MLKIATAALIGFMSVAAAVAQTTTEPPPAKPEDEVFKLREEVERLHRTLEKQQGQLERQIEDLKRSMEARLSGATNGIDAVRIRRPANTITSDPSAPIV